MGGQILILGKGFDFGKQHVLYDSAAKSNILENMFNAVDGK